MFKSVRFDFDEDLSHDYYTAFINDDALGEVRVLLNKNLNLGAGYGAVCSYYKANNKPLAKNLAKMFLYYYEIKNSDYVDSFAHTINVVHPGLISKEVIACTKRCLNELS